MTYEPPSEPLLAPEDEVVDVDAAAIGAAVDEALRATPLVVSIGASEVNIDLDASAIGVAVDESLRETALPVSGPLTDTELRATAVPVSGPLTDTELRETALPVSGPLTDTELRATAVPVLLKDLSTNLVPNSTQADQTLTVDGTVGGVQFAALHADTTHVVLDVQVNDVRVTFDGSAPTATNGHLIPFGAGGIVWSKALAVAAKWIRVTGSSTIHLSQLKLS